MPFHEGSPVRVEATLDPGIGRWLWLVKWLLAIPHYVVLFFLWVAFLVLSLVAFFAILITGRYPLALFEFNTGVLRWSWRVAYYSYSALGTDRYPPFTLADVPDYPAHFDVEYPDHLSRGLVLVKWWLLAIPQYLVVGVFVGGGGAAWQADRNGGAWGSGGLIGLLVLFAAVILLVTGRYPRQIFDFVLGLNRWVLRVVAYAALMTDQYPPFRLDMGGPEPDAASTAAPPAPPVEGGPRGAVPEGGRRRWTAGRIVSLCIGSLLALTSVGVLAGAGAVTWLDHSQRDAAGFLTSASRSFTTSTYAITSDRIDLGNSTVITPSSILGTVRIRATASNPATPVFLAIAPQSAVNRYLNGVSHEVITTWSRSTTTYRHHFGAAPTAPPTSLSIWAVSASGTGTQTLTWKPTNGAWTVVVMRPDGNPGLSVSADAGATVPALGWIEVTLFIIGGLLLIGAVLLIAVPILRASRRPGPGTT